LVHIIPLFQQSIIPILQKITLRDNGVLPKLRKFLDYPLFIILDVIVKRRNQTAKKKDPDARRANPEE